MADKSFRATVVADGCNRHPHGIVQQSSHTDVGRHADSVCVFEDRFPLGLAGGHHALPSNDHSIETERCHAFLAAIATAGGAADPDTVASRLISEFGTLAAAVAGSRRRQLAGANGDHGVVLALRTFQSAMQHALSIPIKTTPVVTDGKTLIEYLRVTMANRVTECTRLLHFDSRNMLIRDELLSEGTIDQSPCYVREVCHRALDLGSAMVIMAHNHPSGEPSPSHGDIQLTKALRLAMRSLNIDLNDHLIIGRYGHFSFRSYGWLGDP